MSEMKQCKATHVNRHGDIERCEGLQGHASAHFDGDSWWPNEDGLPIVTGISNHALTWVALLVMLLVLAAAAIFWALWR